MRAAVMHAFAEPLAIEDVSEPDPGRDGAVVEVRATGLCRSDWHGWMGHDASIRLPNLPGHELAGVVAALGCRFMTAYAALTVRGGLRAGDWLTVFGCGGVGLSAVMLGSALGARVIGVDVNPQALALARELGAEHAVQAAGAEEAIRELTRGGAHLSLDALGSAATAAASGRSPRKRGRHVQVGLLAGAEREPPLPLADVISRELEIAGVHGMA